jgi:hypothetical protein
MVSASTPARPLAASRPRNFWVVALNFAFFAMASRPLPLTSALNFGDASGLEGLEDRFDGRDLLLVGREIEQGLGVTACHVRCFGVVGQLLNPLGACHVPQRKARCDLKA